MINTTWHLSKEHIVVPHQKLQSLLYGSYIITKVVGDNNFELSIPPFLGLHRVLNMDRIWSYFPPLLDTSKFAKQLTPIKLN